MFNKRLRQLRSRGSVASFEELEDRWLLACDIANTHAIQLGDFDDDDALTATDIDLLAEAIRSETPDARFDINHDGLVNQADRLEWIESLRGTYLGDSNLDGEFGTGDFVHVFQAGQYEKDSAASWADGDWDGDGKFSTSDLVSAFQASAFEIGPRPAVVPTVGLLSEFDSGIDGDSYTSFGSVTLTGRTTPFSVVAMADGGISTSADRLGQFFLNNVHLNQGRNDLAIDITTPNCGQTTVDVELSRAKSDDPSPFGHFVTNRVLNPEYRASFASVFLPEGMTLDEFAATVAETAEESPDSPVLPVRPNDADVINEEEDADAIGANDTIETAQLVSGIGTGATESPNATIRGTLYPTPSIIDPIEDNGDINKATDITPGLNERNAVLSRGVIGDGPYGSSSGGTGDFDFYAMRGLEKGQVVTIDVNTPSTSSLDSFLLVYQSDGTLVDANDDDPVSTDSLTRFQVPADGDYFASIAGFGSFGPVDPFDSSSGFGADSEGAYEVRFSFDLDSDADFFELELAAGDVLGASIYDGGQEIALYNATGTKLVSSDIDASFIYPSESPLPRGGNASIAWVSSSAGKYYVGVENGFGDYEIDLGVFRPKLESGARDEHQILYLDFDGASFDATEYFEYGNTDAELSPLADFLGRWGLEPSDEDAVIDAITATVRENFEDVGRFGQNGNRDVDRISGNYQLEIVTSRDVTDAFGSPVDLFGSPNVSRVVIGGTMRELGIATIGIAESIDVGNFATTDTSVVLLDHLSGGPNNRNSLNNVARADGVSIVDLIGTAVGNIAAHEAGHFFANFHTDNTNDSANVMDQGGNLGNLIGLGEDGVFGTSDDLDVDFGSDHYTDREIFEGVEDTLNAIAFGLSSGTVDTGMIVERSIPSNGHVYRSPPTEFVIEFIDPFAVNSIGPATSLSVNGIAADQVVVLTDRQIEYRFNVSPVVNQGVQQLELVTGTVDREADGSASPGFAVEFGYDAVQTTAASISPADGDLVELPLKEVLVSFNEAIDLSTVSTDDLKLSIGNVDSFEIIDETSVRYQVSEIFDEGSIDVQFVDGQVTDSFGNFVNGITATYDSDIGEVPFSLPLRPKLPLGSLIYDPPVGGHIDTGDADRFAITLDPGQTLSVRVDAESSLRASVRVFRAGTQVQESTAEVAGDTVFVQQDTNGRLINQNSRPVSYVIEVSGEGGTSGDYAVQLVLNTAFENEAAFGQRNESLDTAHDLELDVVQLNNTSVERAAVLGSLLNLQTVGEDFESGVIPGTWEVSSSSLAGEVRVLDAFGAASGDYGLLMGVNQILGDFVLNEAVWNVEIGAIANPILSFAHLGFSDEPHAFDGPFSGSFNADGIAISLDGELWYPVFDAPRTNSFQWQDHFVDLNSVLSQYDVSVSGNIHIKFQQYDNVPIPADGRGWDSIGISPRDDADWYQFDLARNESASIIATTQNVADISVELFDADGLPIAVGFDQPLRNGSFESGDLRNWEADISGSSTSRWEVSGAGSGVDFAIDGTSPQDGEFVAWHNYNSDEPVEYTLSQDIDIPEDVPTAEFSWQARIQWLFIENGAAARTLRLEIRDPQTGVVLDTPYEFSTGSELENPLGDSGWQSNSIDLSNYIGQSVTMAFVSTVPETQAGPGLVELDDIQLDIGVERPTNVTDVISNFVADQSGTFYARVSGELASDYSLLVLKNADFDLENNNSIDTAVKMESSPVQNRQWALGYADSQSSDFYSFEASDRSPLVIRIHLPGASDGEFENELRPSIKLYDENRQLIAESDEAELRYRVPRGDAGIHYLEVSSIGETSGEYVLSIQGGTRNIVAAALAEIEQEDSGEVIEINNDGLLALAEPRVISKPLLLDFLFGDDDDLF